MRWEPVAGSYAPAEPLARTVARDELTQLEIDILRLVSLGMTNREIAEQLAISVPMVKWRTNRVFDKLHVRNRVQAVVRAGQLAAPASFEAKLAPPGPMPESLRSAERSILELLAFGLTNRQIAASLGIRPGTVKWYMGELFGKLQVRNRVEALARARQHDWL